MVDLKYYLKLKRGAKLLVEDFSLKTRQITVEKEESE